MRWHRLLCYTSFALVAWCALSPAQAETLVVIVSAESGIEHLSKDDVINIFLGRYKKLPNGISAIPIDTLPLKESFYYRLVEKTPAEINAYWARLIFAGGIRPPEEKKTERLAIARVIETPGAIAYVNKSFVTKQVHIVFELE